MLSTHLLSQLCSTTSAVFHFGNYFNYLVNCGKDPRFGDGLDPVVMTLLMTFAIPLNSTLNTVIYFCRIKDLRTFSMSVLQLIKCRPRDRGETLKDDGNKRTELQLHDF